jgi:ParB/RepB/Spo0J family partition protein
MILSRNNTAGIECPDPYASVDLKIIGGRHIPIEDIKIDNSLQIRESLNEEAIDDYAAAMKSGDFFPPVVVFRKDDIYYLIDGFHRLYAAKKAGFERIMVKIVEADQRQAILAAVGANTKHGLRRTNEDKRRAVLTLLNDSEWSRWSDRRIAKICKVGHSFVSNIRRSLSTMDSEIKASGRPFEDNKTKTRTYRDKHGNTAVMKTAQIGQQVRPSRRSATVPQPELKLPPNEPSGEEGQDSSKDLPGFDPNESVEGARPDPFDWLREGVEESRSFFHRIHLAGGLSVLLKDLSFKNRQKLQSEFTKLIAEADVCVNPTMDNVAGPNGSNKPGCTPEHKKEGSTRGKANNRSKSNTKSGNHLPGRLSEIHQVDSPSSDKKIIPRHQKLQNSASSEPTDSEQPKWMQGLTARLEAIKAKEQI